MRVEHVLFTINCNNGKLYIKLENKYMKTFQIQIGYYELDVALYIKLGTKYRLKNEKQRL